jgi:hypothetical protein
MTDVDLGWQDVLRRAERRRPMRAAVVAVLAVAALASGGSALAVLLTRSNPPRLPLDQIGGNPITSVVDPTTGQTILEYGRWQGHDGVCYLVPQTGAGCLLTGHASRRFLSLPLLLSAQARAARRTKAHAHRFVLTPRVGFRVLALPGGKAKIVRR